MNLRRLLPATGRERTENEGREDKIDEFHTGPMVVHLECHVAIVHQPLPALSRSCVCVSASLGGRSRSWGRGSLSSDPPKTQT